MRHNKLGAYFHLSTLPASVVCVNYVHVLITCTKKTIQSCTLVRIITQQRQNMQCVACCIKCVGHDHHSVFSVDRETQFLVALTKSQDYVYAARVAWSMHHVFRWSVLSGQILSYHSLFFLLSLLTIEQKINQAHYGYDCFSSMSKSNYRPIRFQWRGFFPFFVNLILSSERLHIISLVSV